MDANELERFWLKVRKDSVTGCWLWTDSLVTQGYGRLVLSDGRAQYAHRVSYDHFVRHVTTGMRVEHTAECGNRACVNPEHLAGRDEEDSSAEAVAV